MTDVKNNDSEERGHKNIIPPLPETSIPFDYLTKNPIKRDSFCSNDVTFEGKDRDKVIEKWYAVHSLDGITVNHIFSSWKDCQAYTSGRKAIFKSFGILDLAVEFLTNMDPNYLNRYNAVLDKQDGYVTAEVSTKPIKTGYIEEWMEIPVLGKTTSPRKTRVKGESAKAKIMDVWVDGSFTDNSYSAGILIYDKDRSFERRFSYNFPNGLFMEMNNVAGELQATMIGVEWAIRHGAETVNLYYDYQGIEKWATGAWKAYRKGTILYREFMKKALSMTNINFHKVKGHSGNQGNEIADRLASLGKIKIGDKTSTEIRKCWCGAEASIHTSVYSKKIHVSCSITNDHTPWYDGFSVHSGFDREGDAISDWNSKIQNIFTLAHMSEFKEFVKKIITI